MLPFVKWCSANIASLASVIPLLNIIYGWYLTVSRFFSNFEVENVINSANKLQVKPGLNTS